MSGLELSITQLKLSLEMDKSIMSEETRDRNSPDWPYWRDEFNIEFGTKGIEVRYREDSWPKNITDEADGYRVFMIMCNNRSESESRMDILNKLKNATEENPIRIQNEIFWTERY